MTNPSPAQPYSALIFDVYGTLFSLTSLNRVCQRVTDHPTDLSRLWRTKQLEYSFLRSAIGQFVDFDRITSDALDYSIGAMRLRADATQHERLMNAWREMRPYPDVPDSLRRLADAGIPLVILTNGTEESVEKLLEHAGLRGFFSKIFSSDQARAFKPSPEIYELAQNAFAVDRSSLLMVSSNGFDVAGAKSFGFSVCRIDRQGLPLDPLGFEPDLTARSFTTLADTILGDAS